MPHRLAVHDEFLEIIVRSPAFAYGQMVWILLVETAVHVFRIMDKTRHGKGFHRFRLLRRVTPAKPYQQ